MNIILIPLLDLAQTVIYLYTLVLFAAIITHWLIVFGVINTGNRIIAGITQALERLTEPVLRPVRNVLPDLGGIDISPIVVFLGLQLANSILLQVQAELISGPYS